MSEIQFEEEKIYIPKIRRETESLLTRLVMKFGAKTYAQAQIVLFGVSILVFILTIFVIYTHFFKERSKEGQMPIEMIDS